MKWAAAAMTLVAAMSIWAEPTRAESCARKPVKATGSPAILESAARSRARTAWLKRVKSSQKLGPSYAAWLRATNKSYSCRKSGKHRVCEASAIPCKV